MSSESNDINDNYNYSKFKKLKGDFYSPFTFKDFLTPSVENLFSSQQLFEQPNSFDRLDNEYFYKYEIKLNQARLNKQASEFSNFMMIKKEFSPKFKRGSWNIDSKAKEDLENSYKYSFFKLLYLMKRLKDGDFPFTYDESRLFYGHHKIYEYYRSRFVASYNLNNNSNVVKFIEIPDNFENDLLKIDIYKEISEGEGIIIRYESILATIAASFRDVFLVKVAEKRKVSSTACCLGNCCFDQTGNKLNVVSYGNNFKNYPSTFLNTACFITLKMETLLESGDSVYRKIDVSRLSKLTPKLEVFAVTGCTGIADIARYPGGYGSPSNFSGPSSSPNSDNDPQQPNLDGKPIIFGPINTGDGNNGNVTNYVNDKDSNVGISEKYDNRKTYQSKPFLEDPAFLDKTKVLKDKAPSFIKSNIVNYIFKVDGLYSQSTIPKYDNKLVVDDVPKLKQQIEKLEDYVDALHVEVRRSRAEYNELIDFVNDCIHLLKSENPISSLDIFILQEVTNIKILDVFAINSNVAVSM